MPVHLSVQANTVNALSVKFWQSQGVSRCILSRELTLSEIGLIREACPDAELEVFAHGALCVAMSGRCLISALLSRRDANVGACTNICRSGFKTRPAIEIEDYAHHPGEWMPLLEDEHGSYLLNSKDLCTLPLLPELMTLHINSLKIEGRSRSPLYAAAITRAYRLGIDAVARGEAVPEEAFYLARMLPGRDHTTGLLAPHRPDELQNYEENSPHPGLLHQVGEIEGEKDGRLFIRVKNRIEQGRGLKLLTPGGFVPLDDRDLRDPEGQPITAAPGEGYHLSVPGHTTHPHRECFVLAAYAARA